MNEFQDKLNKLVSFLVDHRDHSLEEGQDLYTEIRTKYIKDTEDSTSINPTFIKFDTSSAKDESALKMAISLMGYVDSPLLRDITLDLAYDVTRNVPEL